MSFAMDSGEELNMTLAETLADEVHRISTKDEDEQRSALEECFKKVCKVSLSVVGEKTCKDMALDFKVWLDGIFCFKG